MFFDKFKKVSPSDNLQESKATPLPSDMKGLDKFIQNIKSICGVDLESKKETIKQRVANFAQAHSIETFELLSTRIIVDRVLRQEVLNLITINETYFYRELAQLQAAIYYAKERGFTRILCAPCSTGEEVYSLGILANSNLLNLSEISIVGIDINSEAIDKCREATYSERSLHRLNDNQKNIYFDKVDDRFKIKKELLPRSEFSVVNIFDDSLFKLGKFDVIFSRNMMIYFDEDYKLKTIERFHKILNDDGRLYTGHADLVPYTSLYKKIIISGASYYVKA
ncbi:protein-glutamate O-methyltransferase CheR [Campylobacter sp. RM15925]|uniref:CheR family methyltransferase n=2 Tax=Campylobacter TaxID=194 RepID=UPI0032E37639